MKTAILILAFLSAQILTASDWKHIRDLDGYVQEMQKVGEDKMFALFQDNWKDPAQLPIYEITDGGSSIKRILEYDIIANGQPHLGNTIAYSALESNHHFLSFYESSEIAAFKNQTTPQRIKTNLSEYFKHIVMLDSLVGIGTYYNHSSRWIYFVITYDGWESINHNEKLEYIFQELQFSSDEKSLAISNYDKRIMLYEIDIYTKELNILHHAEEQEFSHGFDQLHEFSILNDSVIVAVGERASGFGVAQYDLIFKSTNGGKDFKKILDTTYPAKMYPLGLSDVAFYDDRNGVAVGAHGRIYLTNDGGDSWFCDDPHPKYFQRNKDSVNGPFVMFVEWVGRYPIIGTRLGGNIYRYEGDYFDWSIAAPRLFEPKNWVKGQQTELKFRWEEVEGINQYHFELAKDKEFTEIIEDQIVNSTELDVSGLETHTTYHWRVTISHEGEDYISREFYFRTKFDDIETLTPDCNAIDQSTDLELSWTPAGGVEYYHLQIADSANFNSIIYDLDSLSETSYELTELDSGRTYYWRVQSLDYKERSDWSEVCSFTTDPPTSIFSFLDAGEIELIQNRDELQITINGGSAIDYDFSLYNLQGSEIIRQPISRNRQVNVVRINELPLGTYFYRVSSKGVAVKVGKVLRVDR